MATLRMSLSYPEVSAVHCVTDSSCNSKGNRSSHGDGHFGPKAERQRKRWTLIAQGGRLGVISHFTLDKKDEAASFSFSRSLYRIALTSIHACLNIIQILRQSASWQFSGTIFSRHTMVTNHAVTIGRAHSFR